MPDGLSAPKSPLAPPMMRELTEMERLLVWSYRRWIAGLRTREEIHWTLVWRELCCTFGREDGGDFFVGLQKAVTEICQHARRPLRLHPPCCSHVCLDELWLPSLVAACERRDYRAARIRAESLVKADGMPCLLEAASRMAAVLRGRRITLPDRAAAVD